MGYIARRLRFKNDKGQVAVLDESEITGESGLLVILGEPGSGKSRLTISIASRLNIPRVQAPVFIDDASFQLPEGNRYVIIDGLDEVALANDAVPMQAVLSRLSKFGKPNFIIACRADDWKGNPDRERVNQFYGFAPTVMHLEPFTDDDARSLLEQEFPKVDVEKTVDHLREHGLLALLENPLSIKLVGEVASEDAGLPETKEELYRRACLLLVQEENPLHQDGQIAQLDPEELLMSAGAVCACLLISAKVGIWTGGAQKTPQSYMQVGSTTGLPHAIHSLLAHHTRLFTSEGENTFVPIHRTIAEYLGAKWLARCLESGASERRVFQMLHFGGGVPTSVRGINAWIPAFLPKVADRCIEADPFGVLRYGDPSILTLPDARAMLRGLQLLADGDPYFRSGDWAWEAGKALARVDLADEVLSAITHPQRHFHLSSLLLNALPGTALADKLRPALEHLMMSTKANYSERESAADALLIGQTPVAWANIIEPLGLAGDHSSLRLAVHIIGELKAKDIPDEMVSSTYLQYQGVVLPKKMGGLLKVEAEDDDEDTVDDDDEDEERNVVGVGTHLADAIDVGRVPDVLDAIGRMLSYKQKGLSWSARYELNRTLVRLLSIAILQAGVRDPVRIANWIRLIKREDYGSRQELQRVAEFFEGNDETRRAMQRVFLFDASTEPWDAVYRLSERQVGLSPRLDDAVILARELHHQDALTDRDVELWASLVRVGFKQGVLDAEMKQVVDASIQRHESLSTRWKELTTPPKRDYEAEERRRRDDATRKRKVRHAQHQAEFRKALRGIEDGTARGELQNLAKAYFNRYSEFRDVTTPRGRLVEWVGEEIADAALRGFRAHLSVEGLPSAREVARSHAENREYYSEIIMKAGAVELLRGGGSPNDLRDEVAAAVLMTWRQFPDENEKGVGIDLSAALEPVVFRTTERLEQFLRDEMEPQLRPEATHISGLYRLRTDERTRDISTRLALEWLERHSDLKVSVEFELLQIAVSDGPSERLRLLIRLRSETPADEPDRRNNWAAVRFLLEEDGYRGDLKHLASADRNIIWPIRNFSQGERRRSSAETMPMDERQLFQIVMVFGELWPPVRRPSRSTGDWNPWDAVDFLQHCINRLAAIATPLASECLSQLVDGGGPHIDALKHARSLQLRLRRDKEFIPPRVEDIRRAIAGDTPRNIDDLKAFLLDHLHILQGELRDLPTDGWVNFWESGTPRAENECRNLLLTLLAGRFASPVLHAESLMPEQNRADVVAILPDAELPVEVKGQWNADLWHAALTQLDDQYARHLKAQGRGIYLVLWFGPDATKPTKAHPDGKPRPTGAAQLADMLEAVIDPQDRERLSVFVLDVSPGSKGFAAPKKRSVRAATTRKAALAKKKRAPAKKK